MGATRAIELQRLDDWRWLVPKTGRMRVPGLIYADDELIKDVEGDKSVEQVANVACLPGIVKYSIAMPDIHWGYGFPIGGVAAFGLDDGVISPGGVGYDINCGVRLLATRLDRSAIAGREDRLADALLRAIPAGVGSKSAERRLTVKETHGVLAQGAGWAVDRGIGEPGDLARIEEGGCLPQADPSAVSNRAVERGRKQLGTLGSGNHFAEVQYVDRVYRTDVAERLGLREGTLTIMIHSGSRGLGYQVCDESVRTMLTASARYGIELPDRQLCCAPLSSSEGRRYLGAMAAAANFAFANRHVMADSARRVLEVDLGIPPAEHGARTVYDVCHNIAKMERHVVDGERRTLCVHRKGATRSFGPGHPELPDELRDIGQPVLIPGDMGRYSFVLIGQEGADEAFGSACHGAGRRLSRKAAKKAARGRRILDELREEGVRVRSAGMATVLEEIPEAYKDVAEVTTAVDGAGLAARVARLRPLVVVKG